MIITEAGIGQGKGHSQGIMIAIGIEVLVIVDQDQGQEQVLIEIGKDATIAGNMTILQEIVPTPEKRET